MDVPKAMKVAAAATSRGAFTPNRQRNVSARAQPLPRIATPRQTREP
jgi:hypothetical protein